MQTANHIDQRRRLELEAELEAIREPPNTNRATTTPQGPSPATMEYANQCIELFRKFGHRGEEMPDFEIAFEIAANALK